MVTQVLVAEMKAAGSVRNSPVQLGCMTQQRPRFAFQHFAYRQTDRMLFGDHTADMRANRVTPERRAYPRRCLGRDVESLAMIGMGVIRPGYENRADPALSENANQSRNHGSAIRLIQGSIGQSHFN